MSPKKKKAKVSAKKKDEEVEQVTVQKTIDFGDAWPVTSEEDFFEQAVDDAVLPPGPILQNCSGADIQLARAATVRPNLAKGKGRYLMLLPGLLSFKNQSDKNKATPTNGNKETEATTPGNQSKDTTASTPVAAPDASTPIEGDDTSKTSQAVTPKSAASAKPPPTILGKLHGLGTETPKLVIPHGKALIEFPGKMVETTSRFMHLHCHNRKKTVTCKVSFTCTRRSIATA
jgi:hypothetical protein